MRAERRGGGWLRPAGIILAAIAAVAAAGLARWRHEWPAHHFGVVERGKVYRSGQPRGVQWRRLAEHYGIRTVIDLREDMPAADWQLEEQRFCARRGIGYVKVPLGPERPAEEHIDRILTVLTDPRRQPVLVHCEHGSSRTGVVIAAYRMLVCGWSLRAALAESYRYRRPMNDGYLAWLKQLAAGEGNPAVCLRSGRP